MQKDDYKININTTAPRTQRIYKWEKDKLSCDDEWFITSIHCGNCNTRLGWADGLVRFCPKCGFRLASTKNPNPPGED